VPCCVVADFVENPLERGAEGVQAPIQGPPVQFEYLGHPVGRGVAVDQFDPQGPAQVVEQARAAGGGNLLLKL